MQKENLQNLFLWIGWPPGATFGEFMFANATAKQIYVELIFLGGEVSRIATFQLNVLQFAWVFKNCTVTPEVKNHWKFDKKFWEISFFLMVIALYLTYSILQNTKKNNIFRAVNYFCKMFHFRSLTELWITLCIFHC